MYLHRPDRSSSVSHHSQRGQKGAGGRVWAGGACRNRGGVNADRTRYNSHGCQVT